MTLCTDYLDEAFLNHVFRGEALKSPTVHYVGLFTGHPDVATEISGDGYARRHVKFLAPAKDLQGRWSTENDDEIFFHKASGSWGKVSHFAIFDSQSGGSLLTPGMFGSVKLIEADDVFRIPKGGCVVRLPAAGVGAA